MFPYNETPISQLRTSSDIERFGQQALLRALNIGRVVAFVGSGTSLKFGQPTWAQTADRAARLFFELENAIIVETKWGTRARHLLEEEFTEKLSPLVREIKELRGYEGFQASHFIELVEDYFTIVWDMMERHKVLQGENKSLLDELLINNKRSEIRRTEAAKYYAPPQPSYITDPNEWRKFHFGTDFTADDSIERISRNIAEFRHGFSTQFKSISSTDNKKLKTNKAFCNLFKPLNLKEKQLIKDLDKDRSDVACVDAARTLRRRLGVRRFLTLNYDLELEMMLFEEGRATPFDDYREFESFILQKPLPEGHEQKFERGRAVTLQSPSGRVIRSSSSRKETLADLFSFGAFPTNYDASVHHLHGRIDDPNNMIITPKDYQRVYYGANDQKKSFDEARHAVFTGSDIFVLGLGTSEHDVLKPLRDFLELEADRRDAYGKVYYVTTSEFTGKEGSFVKAFHAARRSAMAKTQSLFKDYGMHTLFIDQSFDTKRTSTWTSESASLFAARAEIACYTEQIKIEQKKIEQKKENSKIVTWNTNDVEIDFNEVFEGIYSYAPEPDAYGDDVQGKRLSLVHRKETLLAREVAASWNESISRGTVAESIAKTMLAALKGLDAHLRDRGLVLYCERLERARRSWWADWSELPGLRVAVLGPHRYSLASPTKPDEPLINPEDPEFYLKTEKITDPIIWRQTNLLTSFRQVTIELGNPEDTPQFSGLITATAQARRSAKIAVRKLINKGAGKGNGTRCHQGKHFPTEYPATVARISIPPGGGKGRLLSFFTAPQKLKREDENIYLPFQTLFNSSLAKERTRTNAEIFKRQHPYRACFTVHLTFALEFSSSMIAFARLLQQLLPDLRRELDGTPGYADARWGKFMGHQFQERGETDHFVKVLRGIFTLLQDTCPEGGWKTRMVAFLSYLDRLVDEKGDPFSPIHRAFFRLISGWNDEEAHMRLPIDIVLINSYANQPIRYLSKEHPLKVEDEDRRDEKWQTARWALRRDRKVALEYWTELRRVRPRIMFKEALEHAAYLTPVRGNGKNPEERSADIFELLNAKDKVAFDNDFLPLPPNLRKFMYRRVVNGHYIAGLANAIWVSTRHSETPDANFNADWSRCVSSLDIAYNREKTRGLIDELLAIYRHLDRRAQTVGQQENPSRIEISDETRQKERLRTMTIDHLALMQFPITARTLAACPDVSRVAAIQTPCAVATELVTELNLLTARGLAARYYKFSDRAAIKDPKCIDPINPAEYVYALDTKVAAVLRARANLEVYSQYKLMAFQPNVYPSQPERALKPDIEHFDRVSKVVRSLVKGPHAQLVQIYWELRKDPSKWPNEPGTSEEMPGILLASPEEFAAEMELCNDKLRAAYALVRGTFSISVIARLTDHESTDNGVKPFDEYRTWIRKILNTATLLSKIRAIFMKHHAQENAQFAGDPLPYNHTFLRDEVSWLYNERALVSFLQGRLFDAMPLFEQARVTLGTSKERDAPQSADATHRRVQMNFALAQVERGNIVNAQSILARIVVETGARWPSDTPSVVHCMAKGYVALCYHLTNEFIRAQDGYEEVIKEIGQFNHPRAESIFRRHYADLLRTMSKSRNDPEYKEAISHLRSSEELALGIRATDLQHYSLMAQARLHRDMQNRGHALENLRQVETYARKMGIQKILCEVLKVRGEVLLAEGETTQAGFVTAQSIAISKRNGMRLRKISAAIIQCQILYQRDQKKDAEKLLLETVTES